MIREMAAGRSTDEDVHVLACADCPRVSSVTARGWTAHHVEDPFEDDVPVLAFRCPQCAAPEAS
jgi:hypothetical protein